MVSETGQGGVLQVMTQILSTVSNYDDELETFFEENDFIVNDSNAESTITAKPYNYLFFVIIFVLVPIDYFYLFIYQKKN